MTADILWHYLQTTRAVNDCDTAANCFQASCMQLNDIEDRRVGRPENVRALMTLKHAMQNVDNHDQLLTGITDPASRISHAKSECCRIN